MINAVLRKDIIGLLRLKRVAALQVIFVAALALLVLGTWPQGGVIGGSVSIATGKAGEAGVSDNLMLGLVLGQLVLLALLVPGIAAVAITSEREAGTLEMLYASRLTPLQIIIGKIGLAVAYPILLLISGLPFVALLAWRGELRAGELLLSYGLLVVSALYLAILSLGISSLCRQGATALVIAYIVVLATCGGVLVPAAIMLDGAIPEVAMVLHYIRGFSPVAASLSILRPRLNDMGGGAHDLLALWKIFIPLALLTSAAAAAAIAIRLRKAPSTMEGFGAPTSGTQQKRSLLRRLMFLIDPTRKRKPLGRGNPMVGKERRTSNLRSGSWLIRIFYFSLFLSLALAVMALYGGAEHADLLKYVTQVLVALQIALVTLVVPSLSTGSISSELENGTFELLRLTRLSAGQIYRGKLLPSLLPAILPMIALLPAYGALCFIDTAYITRLSLMAPVFIVSALAMCILGLTCSAWANSTARATVIAYLLASALVVIPMLLWWAAEMQLLSLGTIRYIICLSPMAMAMNLLPDSRPEIYELRNTHLLLIGSACIIMLSLAWGRLAMLLKRG